MLDVRPIAYVFGRILIVLAILMLAPGIVDWSAGDRNARAFFASALVTGSLGAMVAIASSNGTRKAFDVREAYLLTAAIWFGLPAFAAMPLMIGVPHLHFTEA